MGAFKMVSLLEKDNYDCIFLKEGGCMVYPYRPKQCETYPFWAHVLEDSDSWNREGKSCPGINKGRLYTKREIESKLDDRVGNDPIMIL